MKTRKFSIQRKCANCGSNITPKNNPFFYFCYKCHSTFCRFCVSFIDDAFQFTDDLKEDYEYYQGKSSSPQTLKCPICKNKDIWQEKF